MFLADDADGADLPVLLVIFKQKPEIKVKYRKLYNAFTSKNYDRVYAIYNQNK